MVSVKFGSGQADLKSIFSKKGRRQHNSDEKLPPGEPCLEMYLKLSDSFMRKGRFDVALYHIGEAADFNPESPVLKILHLRQRFLRARNNFKRITQPLLITSARVNGSWEVPCKNG